MIPRPHGGVLALDLASKVGWAYGDIADRRPAFGTWKLPPTGGEGGRYAAFQDLLADVADRWRPSCYVLEAPLSFEALLGVSNKRIMCQQYTLRGCAYAEAARASVPCSEVSCDIVRLALLGQMRFPKGKVKGEVVRFCHRRGCAVPDDNAGDGCMVWWWHQMQMRGGRPVAGPLFVADPWFVEALQ